MKPPDQNEAPAGVMSPTDAQATAPPGPQAGRSTMTAFTVTFRAYRPDGEQIFEASSQVAHALLSLVEAE